MRRPAVLVTLAFTLACVPPAPEQAAAPPAVDTTAVTQAISDLWSRYATAASGTSSDAVLALYTETTRLDLQGMPPVLGHAGLAPVLQSMSAARKVSEMHVMPVSTTVVSNSLAYQGGAFMETFEEGGKTSTEYGRYVTAVVRDSTGVARIAYLMAFADSIVARR